MKKQISKDYFRVKTTGKLLSDGKISEAIKEYLSFWWVIAKKFSPFLITILKITFLGYIYNSIYSKLGFDKLFISISVIVIYYLGEISSKLSKKK